VKIVLVIKEIEGGGIQKSYLSLFYSFLKYGHEVYLFVLVKPNLLKLEHPNIIFLNGLCELQRGVSLYLKCKQLDNIDLAIVNAEYMKKYLPIAKNKIFLTVHVTWSQRLGAGTNKLFKLLKLKYRYFNENIITVSDGIKNDLLEKIKIHPQSIQTIADSYDVEEIIKLSQEEIKMQKSFIVAVGSLLGVKRYDVLIKAFALLEDSDLDLIIVGDGRERKSIQEQIKKLNLLGKIHLIGFNENPYKYIKNSKLLVVSSDSEGFSRVIIESLILKTPIVSTDCSPIFKESFFPNELKFFIVPTGDYQLLSKTIAKALVNYPLIDNNFCYNFSDKNIVQKYISLRE